MIKFVSVAAFAVCAIAALPASAADLHVANSTASVIRITLTNKSPGQLSKEIEAAANLVCADANASSGCVEEALLDANRQVKELTKGAQGAAKIEVARDDPTSVRISLVGKSAAQVSKEIETAAAAVCKNETGAEYSECVTEAVQDAKSRLVGAKLAMN